MNCVIGTGIHSPLPRFVAFVLRVATLGAGLLIAGQSVASTPAPPPLGLPALHPVDNSRLVALGRDLFNDPRLSVDGRVSCASCHPPGRQFTDDQPTARLRGSAVLTRRTPSLLNVVYRPALFWDGRESTLEAQALSPLLGPAEHGFVTPEALMDALRDHPSLRASVATACDVKTGEIRVDHVQRALAAYERSLVSGNAPADRYLYGQENGALSAQAQRGLALFRGRAGCSACHTLGDRTALYTDNAYHPGPSPIPNSVLSRLQELASRVTELRQRGADAELTALVSQNTDIAALGRYVATLDPADIGRFRTPSLRNVAVNAPYFHDGKVAALDEAIDAELYARHDARTPIVLTTNERADLKAFLEALTSPGDPALGPDDTM